MVAGKFRHLPIVDDAGDDFDVDDAASAFDRRSSQIQQPIQMRAMSPASPTSPLQHQLQLQPQPTYALLDITKCLYSALDKLDSVHAAHASSSQLGDPNEPVDAQVNSGVRLIDMLEYPDLASLLEKEPSTAPRLSIHKSVLDAAKEMKKARETAILAFEPVNEHNMMVAGTELAGIFTTKDLVLRVLAAGLDPAKTPISRVMTPNPDCVDPDTTVIDALKKMHSNRYLHLPIMDANQNVCGMADVLKLTYSVLSEASLHRMLTVAITRIEKSTYGGNGPLWNNFWESSAAEQHGYLGNSRNYAISETSSTHRPARTNNRAPGQRWDDDHETVLPDDSASAIIPTGGAQGASGDGTHQPREFVFKFKDDVSQKVHRFRFSTTDIDGLRTFVAAKLSAALDRPCHSHQIHLCYLDDESDAIYLANSRDLEDAVIMALSLGWKRLIIVLDWSRMTLADLGTPLTANGNPSVASLAASNGSHGHLADAAHAAQHHLASPGSGKAIPSGINASQSQSQFGVLPAALVTVAALVAIGAVLLVRRSS
eukprot:jgi/Hompol1/2275/HPOL_005945-RA